METSFLLRLLLVRYINIDKFDNPESSIKGCFFFLEAYGFGL